VRGHVIRTACALAALFPLSALTCAAEPEHIHDHQGMQPSSTNEPPIKITINPEARVSVTLAGAFPPPVPCGAAADLLVKIVNNGFVTARLEAELVNTVPVGVTLELDPQPLKGVPEEVRHLRITLTKSGPTDLTVAFRAHHEIPDLGGRDRIHFLMSCLPPR